MAAQKRAFSATASGTQGRTRAECRSISVPCDSVQLTFTQEFASQMAFDLLHFLQKPLEVLLEEVLILLRQPFQGRQRTATDLDVVVRRAGVLVLSVRAGEAPIGHRSPYVISKNATGEVEEISYGNEARLHVQQMQEARLEVDRPIAALVRPMLGDAALRWSKVVPYLCGPVLKPVVQRPLRRLVYARVAFVEEGDDVARWGSQRGAHPVTLTVVVRTLRVMKEAGLGFRGAAALLPVQASAPAAVDALQKRPRQVDGSLGDMVVEAAGQGGGR